MLAVGAGIIASLTFATTSFAVPPTAGANCQPDGRIQGGGATFANNMHRTVFEPSYRTQVCGPVPGGPADAANTGITPSDIKMVLYNYDARSLNENAAGTLTPLTGSGSGINGALCRVDAFEGSDVPFTIAQLGTQTNPAAGTLRGAKPATNSGACSSFNVIHPDPLAESFAELGAGPFEPAAPDYPAVADADAPTTTGRIMAFPVARGSVAVGFNLPAASCGGTAVPSISLTDEMVSALFGGLILNWNDAALRVGGVNAGLANCNVNITRIARLDNSGTTTIFKAYLNRADGATPLCDVTSTWATRLGQNGSNFPSGGSCSPVSYQSGNPGVINTTGSTIGGIGYGDLADWRGLQGTLGLASLRNADNTAYVSPQAGNGSNCTSARGLPAGGAQGSVNLVGNGWASDANPNVGDITYAGNGYPACGFTWILVRPGLSAGAGTGAVSRLNDNQRRTLYSYIAWMLNPLTQAELANNYYSPIPSNFLDTIRPAYISNF